MGSEQKVAVITGGSQGIGAALVKAYRDRNHRVVATAHSTFFTAWIPVVATGAAFFMIILDTSIVNLALASIGTALLLPNSLAALNHTVTDKPRRSKAVSAWASAGALGVATGPILGGLLVQAFGWRSIFIVNVPVGLLALWLTLQHIPRGPSDRSRSLDALGQFLAVGTLATLTYSMISAKVTRRRPTSRPGPPARPVWSSASASSSWKPDTRIRCFRCRCFAGEHWGRSHWSASSTTSRSSASSLF